MPIIVDESEQVEGLAHCPSLQPFALVIALTYDHKTIMQVFFVGLNFLSCEGVKVRVGQDEAEEIRTHEEILVIEGNIVDDPLLQLVGNRQKTHCHQKLSVSVHYQEHTASSGVVRRKMIGRSRNAECLQRGSHVTRGSHRAPRHQEEATMVQQQ